jgi:hypothetical protein
MHRIVGMSSLLLPQSSGSLQLSVIGCLGGEPDDEASLLASVNPVFMRRNSDVQCTIVQRNGIVREALW